jgi:hypothetical protein
MLADPMRLVGNCYNQGLLKNYWPIMEVFLQKKEPKCYGLCSVWNAGINAFTFNNNK